MKLTNKIIIAILLIGLSIGIIEGLVDFQFAFLIFGLTAIVTIIGVLMIFWGAIRSKPILTYGLTLSISMLMSFGVMLLTNKLQDKYRQSIAESVIIDIQDFKKRTGKLPTDLATINCDQKLELLEYSPDSTLDRFTLGYMMDGWNQKFYNSRTEKWIVID